MYKVYCIVLLGWVLDVGSGRLESTDQMMECSMHTRTKLTSARTLQTMLYSQKASRDVVAIVNRGTAMLLRSLQNTLKDELTNAGLEEYLIRSATARNIYCRIEACRVVVVVVTSLRSLIVGRAVSVQMAAAPAKEHYATHASADAMRCTTRVNNGLTDANLRQSMCRNKSQQTACSLTAWGGGGY